MGLPAWQVDEMGLVDFVSRKQQQNFVSREHQLESIGKLVQMLDTLV